MASRHVCGKVPPTSRESLIGLGPRFAVSGRDVVVMTRANWNGSNRRLDDVRVATKGMGIESQGREVPECSAEGSLIDVDPMAFAILRRACSVADGNNFYAEGLASRESHDNSIQYGREACHAVMALEGLNLVPEDVALAAIGGSTAWQVIRPGTAPIGDPRDALARILARLLADGATHVGAARVALEDIVSRTRALFDAAEVTDVQRSPMDGTQDV